MDTHEGTPPFFMHDFANICSNAIIILSFLIFIMITEELVTIFDADDPPFKGSPYKIHAEPIWELPK